MTIFRARLLPIAACVLMLFAACSVPDSGPAVAVRGERGSAAGGDPQVNVAIPEPRQGASPAETFTSFLAAGGVSQNRSRLAEAFVLQSAREGLTQGQGSLVVRSNDQPTVPTDPQEIAAGKATVQVSLQVIGSVSGQGSYQTESRTLDISIPMVRTGGIWLFEAAPPSVLVRESDFSPAFRPVIVYYAARGTRQIIPERRYVDSSIPPDSLATPIVEMLLGGSSPWLSDVTRTTLPSGVRLRGNVVADGDSTIADFSPELESATAEQLNLFAAQIGWSLRRYRPGSLHLQVSGRRIAVAGVKAVQSREDWNGYNPSELGPLSVYAVLDGVVRRFGSSTSPAFGGDAGASAVVSGAITVDGRGAALVREGDGEQRLWVGDADGVPRPVLSGESISRPSWGGSVSNLIVVVDGQLRSVSRDGGVRSMSVSADVGPVQTARLSYDNARVVFTAGEPGSARAYAGVVTPAEMGDSQSGAVTIQKVVALPAPLNSVEDVGWTAPTTALVAGREPDGMAAVWEVEVDGAALTPAPRNGLRAATVAVASAATEPSSQPVYLQLGEQLFQRFRESWTLAPELTAATAPFYPG